MFFTWRQFCLPPEGFSCLERKLIQNVKLIRLIETRNHLNELLKYYHRIYTDFKATPESGRSAYRTADASATVINLEIHHLKYN